MILPRRPKRRARAVENTAAVSHLALWGVIWCIACAARGDQIIGVSRLQSIAIAGLLFASSGGVALRGLEVSSAEAQRPPSEAWLKRTLSPESGLAWSDVERASSDAAKLAATGNRTAAMEGWLQVAQWARLLSSEHQQVTSRWVTAINSAQLGHPNMSRKYPIQAQTLSGLVSEKFVAAVMQDPDFTSSFFQLLTPYDYLPEVLRILDRIYLSDPQAFDQYDQLALAIALIHDVPPGAACHSGGPVGEGTNRPKGCSAFMALSPNTEPHVEPSGVMIEGVMPRPVRPSIG